MKSLLYCFITSCLLLLAPMSFAKTTTQQYNDYVSQMRAQQTDENQLSEQTSKTTPSSKKKYHSQKMKKTLSTEEKEEKKLQQKPAPSSGTNFDLTPPSNDKQQKSNKNWGNSIF